MKKMKKLLSLTMALVLCLGLLPMGAGAAEAENPDVPMGIAPPTRYYDFFELGEGAPQTQVELLRRMISHPKFGSLWNDVIDKSLSYYAYAKGEIYFPFLDYSQVRYTDQGVKEAMAQINGACHPASVEEKRSYFEEEYPDICQAVGLSPDVLAKTEKSPVFYVMNITDGSPDRNPADYSSNYGGAYTAQIFYDFEIHGLPDTFETPAVNAGETMDELRKSGIDFQITGSSDNFVLKVENRSDSKAVATQEYSYQRKTSNSTSASSQYCESWGKSTSIGTEVSIEVPFIPVSTSTSVKNTFSTSCDMSRTYGKTDSKETSETITSKVEVELPAHTKADVLVDVEETRTRIPYDGKVWISYKTILLRGLVAVSHLYGEFSIWCLPNIDSLSEYSVYAFGRNGLSATEDLMDRIANRNVMGYNSDLLHIEDWLKNDRFIRDVKTLHANAPVAPYFGDFYYNSNSVKVTPMKAEPLYPLDLVVPDISTLTVAAGKEKRLDNITAKGYDFDHIPYYGFNAKNDGSWKLVMDGGNPADYAKISRDGSGRPVIVGVKPTGSAKLYLEFQPRDMSQCTPGYTSERITVTVQQNTPARVFQDVQPKDYFYKPVYWAVSEGITSGIGPATFGPQKACTRAQVVTFLWNQAGQPMPSSMVNPFSDLKPGAYYYKAVLWAVEKGITKGLTDNTFGPNAPCTRAQVATFLWNTADKPAAGGSNPFMDVSPAAYYHDAVLWAVSRNITSGLKPGQFGPNATCTRGQIVTFLWNAAGKPEV